MLTYSKNKYLKKKYIFFEIELNFKIKFISFKTSQCLLLLRRRKNSLRMSELLITFLLKEKDKEK